LQKPLKAMKSSGLSLLFLLSRVIDSFAYEPAIPFPDIGSQGDTARVAPYQIVINEIMADPDPCIQLPGEEYIEILNKGPSVINLFNWYFVFGTRIKRFPPAMIEPGEYMIICDREAENAFKNYGKTIPIDNMPAVLNTGQTLILKSPSGSVIHSVTYSPKWYKDPDKANGGWSLEMIDPVNPCGKEENWTESADARGGTPGIKNSVMGNNADTKHPFILRATLPSDSSVMLHFSESMDSSSISSCWLYSANNDLLHPVSVDPVEPEYIQTELIYHPTFKPGLKYTVFIQNTLKDCSGNSMLNSQKADFAVPVTPVFFDVVINEILYHAAEGMSEFIELFNRSEKVLDLSVFSIGLIDANTGITKKIISMDDNPYLFFPDHYVVLTRNAKNLPRNCIDLYPSAIVEKPDLFILPDDGGIIVLMDKSSQCIDEFSYSDYMHEEMLTSTDGVSLERVNADEPSDDLRNWHSAATTAGYSTPGGPNSQVKIPDMEKEEITLFPDVFSPDDDGFDDFVNLNLKLPEQGEMASVYIFDMYGKNIRTIISGAMMGSDESLVWDGRLNDDRLADMGIYIVYVELVTHAGQIKKYKKVVTLAKKL
jgi:gliding motility-associated-like protein